MNKNAEATEASETTAQRDTRLNEEPSKDAPGARRKPLFTNGRCNVCGHLEGDHEPIGRNVYTCDEDGCDEDLYGYCRPSRI